MDQDTASNLRTRLERISLSLAFKLEVATAGHLEAGGIKFDSESRRRDFEARAHELGTFMPLFDPTFRRQPAFIARGTRLLDGWSVLFRAVDLFRQHLDQGRSGAGHPVALLAKAQAGLLAVCDELGIRDDDQREAFEVVGLWARAKGQYIPYLQRSGASPRLLLEASEELDRLAAPSQAKRPRSRDGSGVNRSRAGRRALRRARSERDRNVPLLLPPEWRGKRVLIVGGVPRQHSVREYEQQLGISVEWLPTRAHRSQKRVRGAMLRTRVDVVAVLIRLADHGYGDLADDVARAGKILVRVTGGYSPASIARALLSQAGSVADGGRIGGAL